MRKSILSLLAIGFLFMTSCQKNDPVSKPAPIGEKVATYAITTPGLTAGQIHNMVMLEYKAKYGFHKRTFVAITHDIIKISDSLFGTTSDATATSQFMAAKMQASGLLDANGYFIPTGSEAVGVSYETDASVKSAFSDIVTHSYTGTLTEQYLRERIGQIETTDTAAKNRAHIFQDIYLSSSILPFNEAYGGGAALADAAGWAYGNQMLFERAQAGILDDWFTFSLNFAIGWSANLASCFEL